MKTKTILIVAALAVALYYFKAKKTSGPIAPILGGVEQ